MDYCSPDFMVANGTDSGRLFSSMLCATLPYQKVLLVSFRK